MATAHMPRREQQLDLYPRAAEPDVPHFEQLEGRWDWRHIGALTGLSLLLHAVFALSIIAAVLAMPKNSPIALTARQILNDHSLYVPLAPDTQKPAERPQTNVVSDKDRTRSTRAPAIDRKTLKELGDNLRPGPPAPAGGAQPQVARATPLAQQTPPAPQSSGGGQPTPPGSQVAQLQVPATAGRRAPSFGAPGSAGSVIQQAARAASEQRGGAVESGDYGMGPALANTKNKGAFEIVTDTLGVDFAPYLRRMKIQVMTNWYSAMPETAFAPWNKRGVVVIEFSIMKDGTVTGVRMLSSSGDVALDRGAYAAITASNPMPPLPSDFRADYLTIRGIFHYNPTANEMR
jgi:TonB family protein